MFSELIVRFIATVLNALRHAFTTTSTTVTTTTTTEDKPQPIASSPVGSAVTSSPIGVHRWTQRKTTSMDVTRHNFVQTLRELDAVVAGADFTAIDTELSGLRRLDTKSLHLLDTCDERYSKLRQSIAGFSLIQFGLSCFKHVVDDSADGSADGQHRYVCHSYNFYIFPQKSSINKAMGDRVFAVQTSSLQFLASNGFDFNKLIIDGISYMNDAEEKLCVDTIESQKQAKAAHNASTDSSSSVKSSPAASALTDEDRQFVDDVMAKVTDFLADTDRQTIDLQPCNAFKRRLIYECLKGQAFSDSLDIKTVLVSQTSSDRYISVSKVDKLVKEAKDEELLTEAVGFSKVIQLLIRHQKPVVGHNVLLDLMHTFNQFIEPLPADYKTFRALIHALFPTVYDTKHMSSSPAFKERVENTALGDLYERLKTEPFEPIRVELKNGVHSDGKALHEAGYDSYVTGVCFAGLVHYLGAQLSPKVRRLDELLFADYRNRLFLTYSHDIHHLNLEREEPTPERQHVFHVTFPKEWRTTELYHLFSAFGGVAIGWLNETSALCALKDPTQADKIRKSLLKQSTNTTYKVISYKDFVAKTNSSQTPTITNTSTTTTTTPLVTSDDTGGARDHAKRQSKSRASPLSTPNPHKKTKVVDGRNGSAADSKGSPKATKSEAKAKLFEEPADWEAEPN